MHMATQFNEKKQDERLHELHAREEEQLAEMLSAKYGVDYVHGGVFCAGPYDGPAANRDKEFWENMEVLPGFLDAYEVVGDPAYLKAFHLCWDFSNRYMINHQVGEWIFLAREEDRKSVV